MKEIKLSPNIGSNDIDYRIVQANKFLGSGKQVRITLTFKGRENLHTDIGYTTLYNFISKCNGKPSSNPRMVVGKRKALVVVLNPVKK